MNTRVIAWTAPAANSGLDDDALDLLFQALASQPRRAMLEAIKAQPGSNIQSIAAQFSCSRIAVLKHLAVLESANLVISRKYGRERCLWFNAVPLQQIHEMWTDQYDRYWSSGLLALKRQVEAAQIGGADDDNTDHPEGQSGGGNGSN